MSIARPVPSAKAPAELSTDDLAFVEQLVRSRIAVQLEGKAYLIESRLSPLVRRHGLPGMAELVARLRKRDLTIENDVIEAMTTNETSFFRDQHPFVALSDAIIPRILTANPRATLTIWNAASSSGQESLSVAIMLNEKFPELATPARTKILATDVSPEMVSRCKEAVYSRFEVNRGLSATLATKYFSQAGRNWAANKKLTDLIQAQQLNLIQPWSGLPKCDVVMLRNVLIYFSAEVKRDILTRIRKDVLTPGGVLLLGSSESTTGVDPGYEPRRANGSTIFISKGGVA
ncbi:MAG: protein-glutamate O-methyltransferase CheR [Actinomycetia bacterium]|nr:protein-glutamate O-methyltransferase CheR [Actinomycetes bacterium]MCP4226535.1 protein-glutamate O-methyltransferase CheR [Actinomycetes bacterium]MCP5035330.1 protein-glutamate O-methyltransferase CheR [Actinomycetes bacterium]